MTPAAVLEERPYLDADYNPRHDPMFKARILVDLLEHHRQYRPLGRIYAPDVPSFERCCMVRDAVAYWRRHGYAIEGDRACGYRLVGGQLSLEVESA